MAKYYYTVSSGTAATVTWSAWNSTYEPCTATSNTDYTWTVWNDTYTTGSGSTTATCWYYWNEQYREYRPITNYAAPVIPQRTQEEIDAENARLRASNEELQKQLTEANERAEALLKANLNEEQAQEYAKDKTFTVHSKDGNRKYRIRKGWSHNVEIIEKDKRVATLCAHPVEKVPELDNVLAQKLMLEHAEEAFLKIANRNAVA